jgi:NADPH-dependent glutamate synthase beta subunit-like oxidoreductase/coenzyme F420-reducing hydrogenase delta subunit
MADRKLTSQQYRELAGEKALLEREWPPCRAACPVHVDARGYLELVARGRFKDALGLIREVLPFPGVCGRICHHPCEQDCRRNDVDQPAAIRDLKRFVAERDYPDAPAAQKFAGDKATVAVIGAGPSGLSCALDLAAAGYRPTVFDRNEKGGGLLATAIPPYRLPRKVLAADVDGILAQGVEFRGGVDLGKGLSIEDLRKQGFEAVVIAVGLAESRGLPIPGADANGVELALTFLAGITEESGPEVGERVVVIGGGNVAVDVARSAVRCGATSVKMTCLENQEEQPAWDWETREALEEDVETVYRVGPRQVLVADGKVKGVEFRAVKSVFDAHGKFNPSYDDAQLTTLECDTVIFAIGQMADLDFLAGSGAEVDDRGRLVWSRDTARTSARDVFACGEVVTGPGSAVEAVASGQRTARAVDAFLSGKSIDLTEVVPEKTGELEERVVEQLIKTSRAEMPTVAPQERKTNFKEFELGISEAQALAEARRCMNCSAGPYVITDKCAACLTCLRVCPFDIPVVTEVADINSALCQGCGLCAAECPGNAIVMAGYMLDALKQDVDAALAAMNGADKKLVIFVSGHHAPAALWNGEGRELPPGAREIYLPSLTRLSAYEMVYPFEAGADGVLVLQCERGADRYPGVDARLSKRFELARETLAEIGLSAEKIQLHFGVAGDAEASSAAAQEMMDGLSNGPQEQQP